MRIPLIISSQPYSKKHNLVFAIYDNVRCNEVGYGRLSEIKECIYVNDGEHRNKKIKGCIEQNNKLIYPTSITKYVRISDSQPYAQAY